MGDHVFCRCDASESVPQQVYVDEMQAIRARRAYMELPPPGDPEEVRGPTTKHGLNGLSISGGGIRSATFSLGVMQALAGQDVLKHMDYLSTVSGGGYSGSELTWALYGEPETDDPELRAFVDSLNVRDGFPIGTQDPRRPRSAEPDRKRAALLGYLREHGKYLTPGKGVGVLSGLGVLVRGIVDNLILWVPLTACMFALVMIYGRRLEVFHNLAPAGWVALGGVAVGVVYSLGTFFSRGNRGQRYWMRRAFEILARPYFVVLFVLLVLGTLHRIHAAVDDAVGALSPAMILSGVGAGVWTYLQSSKGGGTKRKVPLGLVAVIGSILLIYGGVLGAFALADHHQTALRSKEWLVWAIIGGLVLYGWLANTNYLSLHRFYRDRLMETFLPEIGRAIQGKTGPSYPANKAPISAMWDEQRPRGPYHLVNTNLVLVDSVLRKQRARGGENFILSPFYCGSDSTAWRRTKDFENDQMTLATAMAISGAAANPNAGVAGKGLTRNRLVSVLMALLNLRLGYWVCNPKKQRTWLHPPNHFRPGLYEVTSGFKETSTWLQLSDGGHFENLALYELIRRRLKLIVVLDGGADPNFNFSDLQNASRRVAEDFGTRLVFTEEKPGDLAYSRTEISEGFPRYSGRVKRGVVTGRIEYPGGEVGTLIYAKTTMVEGLSVETQGYKDGHPPFPDQPTSDQFFDPEQFEAYRELGYVIGLQVAEEVDKHLMPAGSAANPG